MASTDSRAQRYDQGHALGVGRPIRGGPLLAAHPDLVSRKALAASLGLGQLPRRMMSDRCGQGFRNRRQPVSPSREIRGGQLLPFGTEEAMSDSLAIADPTGGQPTIH